MRIITPGGDRISLPAGATSLDAAAAIHGDLLIGLQSVAQNEHVLSRKPDVYVDVFEPVKHDYVYKVVSCLSGDEVDVAKIKVEPSWVMFCHTDVAIARIKAFLGELGEVEHVRRGEDYLKKIAAIYNVKGDDVLGLIGEYFLARYYEVEGKGLKELKGEYKSLDDLKKSILSSIGTAEINPVLILAQFAGLKAKRWVGKKAKELRKPRLVDGGDGDSDEMLEERGYSWDLDCKLPERKGSLKRFAEEFSEEVGIQISQIKKHVKGKDGRKGTVLLSFNLKDAGVSEYDFFRKLIKLSFKYEIKLVGDFMERLGLRNVVRPTGFEPVTPSSAS